MMTILQASDGGEIVEIANESELKWISHLLEVDVKDLKKVFLTTSQSKSDDLEGRPLLHYQAVTSIEKALDIRYFFVTINFIAFFF